VQREHYVAKGIVELDYVSTEKYSGDRLCRLTFSGIPQVSCHPFLSRSQVWELSLRVKFVASFDTVSESLQEAGMQKSERKAGVVIYDTSFGNTEKIARSIASGLEQAGMEVDCIKASEVNPKGLRDFDLIVIGAPTQAFTASKPMKEFIDRLENVEGLVGKSFYAFDTKLPSRFSGSAAKYIESKLEHIGLQPARPRSSAIGRGSVFKLDEGEERRFEKIGLELGADMNKPS